METANTSQQLDISEQKLCKLFLKGFEKKNSDFPGKNVWCSNYSTRYPN